MPRHGQAGQRPYWYELFLRFSSLAMRNSIEEALLRAVRLYTFHTPVNKGKYRIFQSALRLLKTRPDSLQVRLSDGRLFFVNLTTGMQESLFFVGEFERVLTEIATRLIGKGDVCIDVGANFGWYTSLMHLYAGADGKVHAFEPTPPSFRELVRNHELMGSPSNVLLNNLALGDRDGTVQVHLFEGLGTGHASLSEKGAVPSTVFDCRMTTLDTYLAECGDPRVDFVKVDVEGAELMFLCGAEGLFAQAVPPIVLMEMAAEQTANFGYEPNALIEFMGVRGDYEFFAANEYNGTVRQIDAFPAGDIGANVFCVPRSAPVEKRDAIRKYLG